MVTRDELTAFRGMPPGWYRDPSDPAAARYWDGTALSEERRAAPPRDGQVTSAGRTSAPATFAAAGAAAPSSAGASSATATLTGVAPDPAPASSPPGWYPDPSSPAIARFWDGLRWTDETRPAAPPPAHATFAGGVASAPGTIAPGVADMPAGTWSPDMAAAGVPGAPAAAGDPAALRNALPGYDVGTELGRGAFGVVLAGRHRQLGRDVAIKELAPGLVSNAKIRSRFQAEAQVLASIDHPHIVPIYDYVENDDVCALVMERLVGGTVWRRFVDRGFDHKTACAIALVACAGLEGAHHRGVLHRDMKPENMLFGADGVLKVTDFGIARVLGENDTLATRGGELLGTPAYMAPEQAAGSELGPATDVYAVGVMLYELLSGKLPFSEDGGPFAIVMRHLNEEPVPLARVAPTVPAPLVAVVDRALERDPADRFGSAVDFGVAVAEAAGAAWGPGWMDWLEVSMRDPGPIMAAARAVTPGAFSAPTTAGNEVVRPSIELHTGGAADSRVVLSDLMPMRQRQREVPPFPTGLTVAAMVLTLVTLVLGLFGVGSTSAAPSGAGEVTVAGHDVSAGQAIPVDLNRPIEVVVRQSPDGLGSPMAARLTLSLGGVALVHSTTGYFRSGRGGEVTQLDASTGRYIVGGVVPAVLELAGSDGSHHYPFHARASRAAAMTFLGIFVLVMTLIVAAYAESGLRTLRRGRRRDSRSTAAGLVVVGAFAGATAALIGWVLGLSVPAPLGVAIAAVFGATAGLVAALAAMRVGDRARARRQANRVVLVARRQSVQLPGPMPVAAP
jgi:serine/threonine-protein kinase